MRRTYSRISPIATAICLVVFGLLSAAVAGVDFLASYDVDGIAFTNPKKGERVPSYKIDTNHVFFMGVGAQAVGAPRGTVGTLAVWNTSTALNFRSQALDGGYLGFVVSLPYSSEGYEYRVEVAGQISETRRVEINPGILGNYDGPKIQWEESELRIGSFPSRVTAQADYRYRVTTCMLSLGLGKYPVAIKGEITGSSLVFDLEGIPDGEYAGIVVAFTDQGIISSNARKISVSAGIKEPELSGGQGIFTFYRNDEISIQAPYTWIERVKEETRPGEKIELLDVSIDPLLDVYTFRITLDANKMETFFFSGLNAQKQVIYCESREISFKANTPEIVSFYLPKGDLNRIPEEVRYIVLKGSLVEWKQGSGLKVFGLPVPNAVSIDLGTTGSLAVPGWPVGPGGTFGTELVINLHSGEISAFTYSGEGIGVSVPITPVDVAGHASLAAVWNLEKNEDYAGWCYQAGAEVAVGYKGINAEVFVPMTKDGLLPKLDGYYGFRAGWSMGLMASVGITAVKSTLRHTWTFSEFLQNPVNVFGQIFGVVPIPIINPGGDHPDDFAGVVSSSVLNQAYDWKRLKGLAYKRNLRNVIPYIEYKELILEKQTYLEGLPIGSPPDEDYLNRLHFRIREKYTELSDNRYQIWEELEEATEVLVLANGYPESFETLSRRLKEPVAFTLIDLVKALQNRNPVLVIPSGGLYGLDSSVFFRDSLAQYVENGGTLIVFSQQHGYEYSLLPVPQEADGTYKKVMGYGWIEDQSCYTKAAYIETWHPILGGQTKSKPTLNLDGYFTLYPSRATVILRRTINAQPAMILYSYGNGLVIVTSMYSDFAYRQNQASSEEIALIRDLISWAKRPTDLPEINPSETVSINLSLTNNATREASSVKLQIYDPDRSILLSEQWVNRVIPPGSSSEIAIQYAVPENASLGIYHIDYELHDAEGAIIQPLSEADSGRFVVSRPPAHPPEESKLSFSVQSDQEHYVYGSTGVFTIIAFNRSDTERTITAKYDQRSQTFTVPAMGFSQITYAKQVKEAYWHWGRYWGCLWVSFYEENNFVGYASKIYWFHRPSVAISIKTDKPIYRHGERLHITTTLRNTIPASWQGLMKLDITDSRGGEIYVHEEAIAFSPYEEKTLLHGLVLPGLSAPLPIGSYTVHAWIVTDQKEQEYSIAYASFNLLESQIRIRPVLPSVFTSGSMPIPFVLKNEGELDVYSGHLNINIVDPSQSVIFQEDSSFSLMADQSTVFTCNPAFPPALFGTYRLTYTQTDETKQGRPQEVLILNSADLSLSFDKSQYKVRETVNLTVDLTNTGLFQQDDLRLTIRIPQIGYAEIRSLSLSPGQQMYLAFTIPIPETIASGEHEVEARITLPSGSEMQKTAYFTVPDPLLVIDHVGENVFRAGEKIDVVISNHGGLDTDFVYRIALSGSGERVYMDNGSGHLEAGSSKTYGLQIPSQVVGGTYILDAEVFDRMTGARGTLLKSLQVSGLAAALSVRAGKESYFQNETIDLFSQITNGSYAIENAYLHLQAVHKCSRPASYHISTWDGNGWVERAVLHFPVDLETRLIDLSSHLPDASEEYKVRIRHEGMDTAWLDYVGLRIDEALLAPVWGMNLSLNEDILESIASSDNLIAFVLNNEVEVRWLSVPPSASKILLMRANEGFSPCQEMAIWQEDIPITQMANTTVNLTRLVDLPGETGKFYFQAALLSRTGQVIAWAEHPFLVTEGSVVLRFDTDKDRYRPGEMVTVRGEVMNLSPIEMIGLTAQIVDMDWMILYSETFDLPPHGTYVYMYTTVAVSEGTYSLDCYLSQNGKFLASVNEKYEVVVPNLSISLGFPSVVDHHPFEISLDLENSGKMLGAIELAVSGGTLSDVQSLTLQPGERRLIKYTQTIASDTTYTIDVTGDLNQTFTAPVRYGEAASITLLPEPLYPEGRVTVPLTIHNTGLIDETVEVTYQLNRGAAPVYERSKTYSVLREKEVSDVLSFDLTEGNYELMASSERPSVQTRVVFSVRGENRINMEVNVGAQMGEHLPVSVELTNLGFNSVDGRISVNIDDQFQRRWNGEELVSQLLPESCQRMTVLINPSTLSPGTYTLNVAFLNHSRQILVAQDTSLTIRGPSFEIAQAPSYQTFIPCEQATLGFRLRNRGNQGGIFELSLSSYDLVNLSKRGWLGPGEEIPVNFNFQIPDDVEEKDYVASYRLEYLADNERYLVRRGEVQYHLAGVVLTVTAVLDKPYYNLGDTAHLSLTVSSPRTSEINLYARVNYGEYERAEPFVLNGSQTLSFDIPLLRITGQKVFYGIYFMSGQSLHLNSLYIHEAGEVITITTDKQIYRPSEVVNVTLNSVSPMAGTLTLTAPSYTESFAFDGAATRSFVLAPAMSAGTYFVKAELVTPNSASITVSHPFDVAGIQVRVLECRNDRGKYASSDTVRTDFTIFSNVTTSGVLKTWILTPEGKRIAAGEKDLFLSSSENLLVTHHAEFTTSTSGIHRLVYGIYVDDLFLASGSEVFDVGEAVLLSLSTERAEYATGTEPVNVAIGMMGTMEASLNLQLDEVTVRTESVSLNGLLTLSTTLGNVLPGIHRLKATLTAGGLSTSKETSFLYGSNLPDLVVRGYPPRVIVKQDNTTRLSFIVTNQGRTASGSTTVSIYDGANLVGIEVVNALNSGATQEVGLNWNVLGKSGQHTVWAEVDSENRVTEFNETNNSVSFEVSIPELMMAMATDKEIYRIRDKAHLGTVISNLASVVAYSELTLETEVTNSSLATVFYDRKGIIQLLPMQSVSLDTVWDTAGLTEGLYRITQTLSVPNLTSIVQSRDIPLVKVPDFEVRVDVASQVVIQGQGAHYTAWIDPLDGFNSPVNLTVTGLPAGAAALCDPASLTPPGSSVATVMTTDLTPPGRYPLVLVAESGDLRQEISLNLDVAGFTVEVRPTSQTIKQIETASYTINLLALNGYEGKVTLEVVGELSGLVAELESTEGVVTGAVGLTLYTSKHLNVGSYDLRVIASDGLVEKRAEFRLTVEANPGIAYGIVTTPGPAKRNPALVSLYTTGMELIGAIKAFGTRYGANAVLGDVDGDGYDEIIVAPGPDPNAGAKVRVFRRDGSLMGEFQAFDSKKGATLAAGDLDGDWRDEVVIGMGPGRKNRSRVKVVKYEDGGFVETGLDFIAFGELNYGVNLALGDLDGDGRPEIIAGAGPGPSNPSRVRAFKIDTSQGVGRWSASSVIFDQVVDKRLYGVNVASGDVDGDGMDEIITGMGHDPNNGTKVRVLRGDGSLVKEFPAYKKKVRYGVNVSFLNSGESEGPRIVTGMGPGPENPSLLRIFSVEGELLGEYTVYPGLGKGVKASWGRNRKQRGVRGALRP